MNFIGPNDGQGIKLYLNAAHFKDDSKGRAQNRTGQRLENDGKIVIGTLVSSNSLRFSSQYYASVCVDELVFFNQSLPESEIKILSQ